MATSRDAIAQLLATALSQAEVGRRLGLSPATVCRHAKALGVPPDEKFRRRYDWAEAQPAAKSLAPEGRRERGGGP